MKWAFLLAALLLQCSMPEKKELSFEKGSYKYRIDVYGDSRDGENVFSSLMQLANTRVQSRQLFSIHLGDLISRPQRQDQSIRYHQLIKTFVKDTPFLPVVGNHDVDSRESLESFRAAFPVIPETGYYAKKIEDVFFVGLNTTQTDLEGSIGSQQLLWLQERLESPEAKESQVKIVAMHHPINGQGPVGQKLQELYTKHQVNFVFMGHIHAYKHWVVDKTHHIISGGGGSPIHGVFGDKGAFFHYVKLSRDENGMGVEVIDLFGEIREAFYVAI